MFNRDAMRGGVRIADRKTSSGGSPCTVSSGEIDGTRGCDNDKHNLVSHCQYDGVVGSDLALMVVEIRGWIRDSREEIRSVYLVSGIAVPCDTIGADNCSE